MAKITQAFVLGAGMGLRLRPMTEQRPKPLVPIFQKPLITFSLDHLRSVGVESFVINTHRLKEQFDDAFASGNYDGAPVKLLHEPDLLETGGGIKNAETSLRPEPFIVYSGDILTDIDLQPLIDEHFASGKDVTLALRDYRASRQAVAFPLTAPRHRYQPTLRSTPARTTSRTSRSGTRTIFERIPPAKKMSFV
jgi:mannose-1-phosphate guanylyltransferase/mannose-1-phosphate guanylyltransferase/phosphomannomutase